MPDLVTLVEMKAYLGDAPATADDTLLTALLDTVEAQFESATLRVPGYYTAADTARTEIKDGTGSKYLWLDYPVDDLTSVTIGYDGSEVLDLTDRAVISYSVGSRRLARTDGGWFGSVGQAGYIEVVYDHLGNLPEDAKLAIQSVVASIYRARGSEGMKSETVGDFYSYTRADLATATATDPFWQQAVINNTPAVLA